MDYLKGLSIQLGGKIREQQLYNWNFRVPSYREFVAKNYRGFKIEVDEFGDILEIKIETESDWVLAINNPEKISSIDKPFEQLHFSYQVFTDGEDNPFEYSDLAEILSILSKKTKELALSADESIFVKGYCITLALSSIRNLISIIDDFIDLIKNHPAIFYKRKDTRIFSKNIPENLRPLIPLLKKWCIPDDSEREQLLEETSEKQKSKLLNTVRPYMVEINTFLDSFKDDPLSHEAILLGNLAELISEIWVENLN